MKIRLNRMAAMFCIVLGSAFVLPQLVADDPAHLEFLGGLLLVLVGMLILSDDPEWYGP